MDIFQTIVLLFLVAATFLAVTALLRETRGGGGVRIEDLTEAKEGCAVGGDLTDGTWCYAPDDAEKNAASILVLRDTPKVRAVVDGKEVELRGGFRGFRNVPPGVHEIVVFPYEAADEPAAVRIDVPAGACMVLVYQPSPNRLEPDRTYGVQYIPLALSGAMDSALFLWPDEGRA